MEKKKKKQLCTSHRDTYETHTRAPEGSRQQKESSAAALRDRWGGGGGGGGTEGAEVALRWCWGGGGGAEVAEVALRWGWGGAEVVLRWLRWCWGGRGGPEVAEVARRWLRWRWGGWGGGGGLEVALKERRWCWGGSGASGSGTAQHSWWRRRSEQKARQRVPPALQQGLTPVSENRGQWRGKGEGGSRQKDMREELPTVCSRMLALRLLEALRLKHPLLGHG